MSTQATRTAESAPCNDLVERLRSASNDVCLVHDLVESSDSASVAAAIVALLTGPNWDAANDAKRREQPPNRPCRSTPNETFVEILLFADRDALDAMQLSCRFLLEFIKEREVKELPLRSISQLNIGESNRYLVSAYEEYWLPILKVVRHSNAAEERLPDTVNKLVPYLRVAYCESVHIDLRWSRYVEHAHHKAATGTVFGDLVVPSTFVDVLTVRAHEDNCPASPLRAIEALKPLNKVVVKVDGYDGWATFDVAFFISAAECGVRSITFDTGHRHTIETDLLAALSFGFAEPITGGDRSISKVTVRAYNYADRTGVCDSREPEPVGFLAQLIKKASELDGRQHLDFKFVIDALSKPIDAAGFEKYQKGERSWLVNDLENCIALDVEEAERIVKIHVFSST